MSHLVHTHIYVSRLEKKRSHIVHDCGNIIVYSVILLPADARMLWQSNWTGDGLIESVGKTHNCKAHQAT